MSRARFFPGSRLQRWNILWHEGIIRFPGLGIGGQYRQNMIDPRWNHMKSLIMMFIESRFWSLQHHCRWKNSWTIGRKLYFELKGHQSSLMLLGILRFFVCAGFYQGNELLNTYTIIHVFYMQSDCRYTYVYTMIYKNKFINLRYIPSRWTN